MTPAARTAPATAPATDWFPFEVDITGSAWLYWIPGSGDTADRALKFVGKIGNVVVRPLELPGHGRRFPQDDPEAEPDLATSLYEPGMEAGEAPRGLVPDIADAIEADKAGHGGGIVLAGHSLGAVIAYEVARELHRRNPMRHDLAHVVACNAAGPMQWPPDRPRDPTMDQLAAELLLAGGGLTLDDLADPEDRRYNLLPYAADRKIGDSYRRTGTALMCPITAVSGRNDTHVSEWDVRRWACETDESQFSYHQLPGRHFAPFLDENLEEMVGILRGVVRWWDRPIGASPASSLPATGA